MIRKIVILESIARTLGIQATTFRALDRIVVLAGPNGAGKSRYLQAVAQAIRQARSAQSQLAETSRHRAQAKEQLDALTQQRAAADKDPDATPQYKEKLIRQLVAVQKSYETLSEQFDSLKMEIGSVEYARPDDPGSTLILSYEGTDEQILDVERLRPDEYRTSASSLEKGGFSSAHKGISVYLTKVAKLLWNARHPDAHSGAQRAAVEAHEFNEILKVLLGTTVEPRTDDHGDVQAILRKRGFRKQELSRGEKVLLTWAITLHKQRTSLENAVILVDEPENHLHPDACITALERLQDLIGEHGQIWVATHSVPLIAYANMDSLYLVKDNAAVFARNKVAEVMSSLLGGPDGRDRLARLLLDATAIAAARFLVECLVAPRSVDTEVNDPQKEMFREIVKRATAGGKKCRLLDYGAGRGRLAGALSERAGEEAVGVEYYAFSPQGVGSDEERNACLQKIEALGQEGAAQAYHWESAAKLEAQAGGTFDIVVLCNVLHEIDPRNWIELAQRIGRLLSSDGHLIVLEDVLPASGELPHHNGYVMLDEFGLKKLFADTVAIRLAEVRRDGRLIAVDVPKAVIPNATHESRIAALRHVETFAREELGRIRSIPAEKTTATDGRVYAHAAMQLANARFALDELAG